jgi:hypothetical protein
LRERARPSLIHDEFAPIDHTSRELRNGRIGRTRSVEFHKSEAFWALGFSVDYDASGDDTSGRLKKRPEVVLGHRVREIPDKKGFRHDAAFKKEVVLTNDNTISLADVKPSFPPIGRPRADRPVKERRQLG